MATADEKKYRFTRKDFQPLETRPLHFDMVFDITEAKVCAARLCLSPCFVIHCTDGGVAEWFRPR